MRIFCYVCLMLCAVFLTTGLHAQVDLINSLEGNKSQEEEGFQFTEVINHEGTTVKNQGASGTCWSYCTNSFLESEMIRIGREPVDLAEMYTVRNQYIEKADMYVRMHGGLLYGQGGALHDVTDLYGKYGALPQEVYSGLNYGTDINRFGEMEAMLKGMLEGVIANKNRQLSPVWKKAFASVVDTYLGEVPKSFIYKEKYYTPKTFAKEVVGLNADDYIEFTSWENEPLYERVVIKVPDNWSYATAVNVAYQDMTDIVDHALKNGFTVAWAADVSEKGFSWKNGIAYVPATDYKDMSEADRKSRFAGPRPEKTVSAAMRQDAFDNYTTTDDHGMQITGIVKDQNGKEYYVVKNSWGQSNNHDGYLYVTKEYFRFKTTSFMVHKGGVPKVIIENI